MSAKDVLIKMAPVGLQVLKRSLEKVNTTGKTSDSLKFVIDTVNLRLIYKGRGYFEALETYRGPRTGSKYGGFDDSLEEWMQAKGFPQKVSKKGVKYFRLGNFWFSGKSLAWKINKEGNKKWQGGSKVRDVYSDDLDEFIELLMDELQKDMKKEVKNTVLNSLKAA